MDEEEREFARLEQLWRKSWQARCLNQYEVEEVKKEVTKARYELREIGDAICATLHDLMVATQDIQRLLGGEVKPVAFDSTDCTVCGRRLGFQDGRWYVLTG